MLDEAVCAGIAEACHALAPENGADEAATFIAELAASRRPLDG